MYKFFKRFFDLFSATTLFIIISPLFVILSFLVGINLGFPIFFVQTRAGKNMKEFKLIKFRTMKNLKSSDGKFLPDEQRMTKFGNWLRSKSIDELPELLNIIIGDMSVIGPRPLPVNYNEYIKTSELPRFKVRGGLITPDSIDESPIISWDKQLDYEADYAKNLSFSKDLKIFFSVFKILFKRNKQNYGEFVRRPLSEERAKMKEN